MSTAVITQHLAPEDLDADLHREAACGLGQVPKHLPSKWFYDDRGSALFEEITALPEYYPTRAERSVLLARAEEILNAVQPDTLVELGSGASEKTKLLLDAGVAGGWLRTFVPFDVCGSFLSTSAATLACRYPTLEVQGVVGDFERHLDRIPLGDRTLVGFLGGTIGNLEPVERARFLRGLAAHLAPGDALLLGTDLVKDPARLVAAYDDAAGVTAEFNRNLLVVLNDRLGADFDPLDFDHLARWDPHHEWMEMHLRARRAHDVRIQAFESSVHFESGELMRTEVSAKFRRGGVERELAATGFGLTHWWTDPGGDFGVSLSVRSSDAQ